MLLKCWPNYLKTAISGIFPVLPTEKNFFTRNGYHHSLNIINTHLWAKNHKKTNDKILRKVQKTVISGIFARENPFWQHQARWLLSYHFFASVCQISAKNIAPVSRYAWKTIFPSFSGVSGDFLTVSGAKKAITADSMPVLGGHDQNTSINKKLFHKCYQNADRIT